MLLRRMFRRSPLLGVAAAVVLLGISGGQARAGETKKLPPLPKLPPCPIIICKPCPVPLPAGLPAGLLMLGAVGVIAQKSRKHVQA
jgi:hypothetical protein